MRGRDPDDGQGLVLGVAFEVLRDLVRPAPVQGWEIGTFDHA